MKNRLKDETPSAPMRSTNRELRRGTMVRVKETRRRIARDGYTKLPDAITYVYGRFLMAEGPKHIIVQTLGHLKSNRLFERKQLDAVIG